MSEEKQHKRRVHYSGKYPKKFEEKYKELNPEKYKDTIEHVISKGNTPAGMHISIMVKEIIDFLDIKPGQTGFDATLGYGTTQGQCLKSLKDMDICLLQMLTQSSLKRQKASRGSRFWRGYSHHKASELLHNR